MNLGPKQSVGQISYYANGNDSAVVPYMFAQDIDKDGIDEIFIVGFESQPTTPATYSNTIVNILGWENGQLKNLTEKWLPGNSNQVGGVGDVVFGDFNGDGNIDVYLSAYTDMDHPVEAYVLWNRGTFLEKESLGDAVWEHAVAAYDINKDGFDDIVTAGYSRNLIYLGSPTGLTGHLGSPGSSGVAVGDFLNDGSTTAVYVDAGSKSVDTFLYALDVNDVTGHVDTRFISTLPGPRIENLNDTLMQDSDLKYSIISSHDIRARAIDFNDDGLLDVVVFSYRYDAPPSKSVHRSEIQFLENVGNGVFVDATDRVRVDFDVTSMIGYYPSVGDFNLDGYPDIFSSNIGDVLIPYNSTSLLLGSETGQFTSVGKQLFDKMFLNNHGQGVLAKGPDNKYHLVTVAVENFNAESFEVSVQSLNFPERDQSEILKGTRGNDVIYGFGGNDTITGGFGNDTLDGGEGLDTVIFQGSSHEYSISIKNSNHLVVDSINDRDGSDVLINIERLQFSDINIGLDLDGTAGQAYRIYEAVLDRAPDLVGLGYWINDMDNGVSLTTIAQGFIASPEFQGKYGANPSYEAYINFLYNNILDRDPDAEGFNYWLTNMQNGVDSPAVVLASFSEGYENTANVAPDISNGVYYTPWMT